MEVVIRPVRDAFLTDVVFPAFESAVVDGAEGIGALLTHLNDEETRIKLELLQENVSGSIVGIDDPNWAEVVYRLLFDEWLSDTQGWTLGAHWPGYAGDWEETLHFALMLEDATYPYAAPAAAAAARRVFFERPQPAFQLASMLCGVWDPVPQFPPDQVLSSTGGEGLYQPHAGICRAEWTWRPNIEVTHWAARLPSALSRLLDRELKRLRPVTAPERHEVLNYWLGRAAEPPLLTVTFSGLGPSANGWIRELGALCRLVRDAADERHGLTVVVSRRSTGDHA
jgi:hypothetical protein